MASIVITMVQHVVPMIPQTNIDKLNKFMKSYVMMDVILIVINDLDLIVSLMIIVLIKLPSIVPLIMILKQH